MKRFLGTVAAVFAITVPIALPNAAWGQTVADPHRALIRTYCVTCHNTRLKTGGLTLDSLDLGAPANNVQIWEKALRKLRGHQMPPPGSPQPALKDADAFVAWLENELDTHVPGPTAGY